MTLQLPADAVEQAIQAAALGPASVTIGGETVTMKDVSQLIAADEYLIAKQASANNVLGISFGTFKFPGAG